MFRRNPFTMLLVIAVVLMQGCKKQQEATAVSEQKNPAEVKVTQELAGSLQIGSPEMKDVVGALEIAAHVQTDTTRIARVGSPVSGRILKILVFEGQMVRAGAALAT